MTEAETYQEWSERMTRDFPCDICGGNAGEVHHIARGGSKRVAKRAMCAVLFVCRPCHSLKVHKGMSVAEQLAWLMLRRPADANPELFWKLTRRRWPDLADIESAHRRLWNAINERITRKDQP